MKFWVFFLVLGIAGYFLGVMLDAIAMGEDSKLMNLVNTGFFDSNWIPYSTTYEKLSLFGIFDNSEYSFVVPIIKYAGLAENSQIIIEQGTVSFDYESTLVDPDGIANSYDEYIVGGISFCNFHSYDDVPFDTCVLCTLASIESNGTKTPIAQGRSDLPDGYQASTTVKVQITEFAFDYANEVNYVDAVTVQLCDNGMGCTTEFWKQQQNLGSWPATISPGDSFENIFGRNITSIQGWTGAEPDPTLLEVLSNSGTGINDLAANSVAALINAETLIDSFEFTPNQVISMTQQAIDSGDFDTTKNKFLIENEKGCPL